MEYGFWRLDPKHRVAVATQQTYLLSSVMVLLQQWVFRQALKQDTWTLIMGDLGWWIKGPETLFQQLMLATGAGQDLRIGGDEGLGSDFN